MKLIKVVRAESPYKYTAHFELDDGKTKVVSFGREGFHDFILYNRLDKKIAEVKKSNYLKRHRANEDWNDPTSRGALSRWILWNLPTLEDSVKDFKNRFHL